MLLFLVLFLSQRNLTICFILFDIILSELLRARVTQTLNCFYHFVFVRKYALFMLPLSNKDVTLELCPICFTLSSLCWLIFSLFSLQLNENSCNICKLRETLTSLWKTYSCMEAELSQYLNDRSFAIGFSL